MPKLIIKKSISIDKSPEQVFTTLTDFNQWTPWSPWIITEPETKVTVTDNPKTYKWQGKRTGEGQMIITEEVPNSSIKIDLTFLKPWKSHAKVYFEIEPDGDGSKVSWGMDSSLPFFMFWMKKMMTAFIGMDYERGLKMLKDYSEQGHVPSTIEFDGIKSFEGCSYVGIKTTSSLDNMAADMEKNYTTLMPWFMNDQSENQAGNPLTIYHKWEPAKNSATYTCAVPLKKIPSDLPEGTITGSIPSGSFNVIGHIGPYDHIGNAWSTQYSMHQSKVFKPNKKISPFEIYLNSPKEVEPQELRTKIYMAVK